MFLRVVYILVLTALFPAQAFFQVNPSTQTDKQKVAVVVPTAKVDDEISLIEGRVVLVYDGDHISIQGKDKKIYSIRLQGVDAPEDKQSYGKKARKKLDDLVGDKDVKVIVYKKDMYDRYVGSVYLNGQDIGLKMIEAGMAWHFKRFSGEQTSDARSRYAKAEVMARTGKTGLWGEEAPMPPWEYRNEDGVEPQTAAVVETPKTLVGKTTVQPTAAATTPGKSGGRTYILGPRGGCYYLGDAGNKVYVKDKTLCNKP